jgi:hypothetical protein
MNIKPRFNITTRINIDLDEEEARALEALAGYGTDAFLKVFYEHLGKHYMQPYEAGLKRILDVFQGDLKNQLNKIDQAKKIFNH